MIPACAVGSRWQTLDLVHLRTSQINGCAGYIYLHADDLGKTPRSPRYDEQDNGDYPGTAQGQYTLLACPQKVSRDAAPR